MEHVCSVVPAGGGGPESDRYLACLRTQLLSLRTDFGKDLGRLSVADRKTVDTACNEVRATSGRDAYLDCVGNQLTVLRSKRARSTAAAPPVQPAPELAGNAVAEGAPAAPAPQTASSSSSLIMGAGALIALVAGGGGFIFLKTRRASHKCRVCGASVEASGDLCQKCRHEAAETVRRAVAERAEQQRAQEEEQQRLKDQAEHEERERLRKAQADEEARIRREQEREQEETRKREAEERRQREEEARERRLAGAVPDEEFDPYEVLDIPRDAGPNDVLAAYQVAREKADPSQVSHLSDEVQEHFRMKAKAVERAFQMLGR
jgi:LPXTG-motif cell wall-anchored protein